jgi:hypothetical protein
MRVYLRSALAAVAGVLVLLMLALGVASASGAVPGPGFTVEALAGPTIFSSEHDGKELPDTFTIYLTNSGSEPTGCTQEFIESGADPAECPQGSPVVSPITIADRLPRGLTVRVVDGTLENERLISQKLVSLPGGAVACEALTVTCSYGSPLQPGERLAIVVQVTVAPGTVGPVTNSVLVAGGGAPGLSANTTVAIGTAAESAAEPFGIAAFSAVTTGVNSLEDAQAGDHPYETTVSFSMNTSDGTLAKGSYEDSGGLLGQDAHVKDTVVDVPAGVTGDPTVVERCPQYKASVEQCPTSSLIGVARIRILTRPDTAASEFGYPVYNVVPDKGYPAEFVITTGIGGIIVPLYVSVIPENNYEVRVTTPGIPEGGSPVDVSVTFFGTPETDLNAYNEYRDAVTGVVPTAFLDNPVDCAAGPQTATLWADSWENQGPWLADGQPDVSDPRWASRSTTMFSALTGCELLQFDPSLTVIPDTTQADEAAGFVVEQHYPQGLQQFPALISPELKETTVTLPSGVSLNPSSAEGLEGCTDAQIDLGSGSPATCPNGSQVGTIEAETPLLTEPLKGQVYLGTPNCDPCRSADAEDGNMLRIFIQLQGSGTVIKQEGRIHANPVTGQLTTTFKDLPQLPASNFKLHFNNGLRSGLATPQACGTFTGTGLETPWSSPITPSEALEAQFNISWNGEGEACPSVWPFHPEFEAGTSNPNAGQYSPLTVTLNREDREQDLQQIKVTTPPGLIGSITGVPLCGEPQADQGTCSEASQIGELTVSAGVGSHPFYQKGKIYLTGPYEGAPFGLSIVVPAHAGPFNLGNIVVRARINIDPTTTALTVTSGPLPQVIDGVQLRVRKTNVTINRPNFIVNPTDCQQQHITATISGSQGTQSEASVPFAVAGCPGLPFAPKTSVWASGQTSRADGANLRVRILEGFPNEANVHAVKVQLPKQLPSRLSTLQKACTAAQFNANPAGCPAASVIGAAYATTPLLPVALRGPVYFVSNGGEAFPNVVIVLQGYGVRVDIVGNTYISKAGITSSTFKTVPDARVIAFEIFLPEGPYSALAANGNLCKQKLAMPLEIIAQNNTVLHQEPKIAVTGCTKAKKRAKKTHRASHGKGRKP